VREWIAAVGARTAFIEPGSPWENGYCESFNSKLRDELLNGEIFPRLAEAGIVVEGWRQTTTRSDRTRAWATVRQHLPLRRGRLCHPNPLRRPPQPSPARQPCIRFEPDHLTGASHSGAAAKWLMTKIVHLSPSRARTPFGAHVKELHATYWHHQAGIGSTRMEGKVNPARKRKPAA